MIEYLYPLETDEYKTTLDFLKGLSVFRLYIEDANPDCKKGITQWNVEDWEGVTREVEKR